MKETHAQWWIRDGEESDDEKRDAHVVLMIDQMLDQGCNFFECYAFYRYQFNMRTIQLLRIAQRYNDVFPWLFTFLKDQIAKVECEILDEGNEWMLKEKRIHEYF